MKIFLKCKFRNKMLNSPFVVYIIITHKIHSYFWAEFNPYFNFSNVVSIWRIGTNFGLWKLSKQSKMNGWHKVFFQCERESESSTSGLKHLFWTSFSEKSFQKTSVQNISEYFKFSWLNSIFIITEIKVIFWIFEKKCRKAKIN